jgi:hypothetical protein
LTPSIILSSCITPSASEFALFSTPCEGGPFPTKSLFNQQRSLFEQPISQIFSALREVEHFQGVSNNVELALSIPELGLKVTEDNVHSYEISLKDIHEVYAGCELPDPMVLEISTIAPRFITRFKAIAEELNRVIAAAELPDLLDTPSPEPEPTPDPVPRDQHHPSPRVDLNASSTTHVTGTSLRRPLPLSNTPAKAYSSVTETTVPFDGRMRDNELPSDLEEEYGADADVEELGSPLGEPLRDIEKEDLRVFEKVPVSKQGGAISVSGGSLTPQQIRPPVSIFVPQAFSRADPTVERFEYETGVPSYAVSPTTTIHPSSSPTVDIVPVPVHAPAIQEHHVAISEASYREMLAERYLLASSIQRVASANSKRSYENAFDLDGPEGQIPIPLSEEQALFLKRAKVE